MLESIDSALDLAADLNNPARKKINIDQSDGIYSDKSYEKISEREEDDLVNHTQNQYRDRDNSNRGKEMTFADKNKIKDKSKAIVLDEARPYRKLKHIFEIQVKELKNIPILDKLIKDINALESSKF